jgi:hypothetical protein
MTQKIIPRISLAGFVLRGCDDPLLAAPGKAMRTLACWHGRAQVSSGTVTSEAASRWQEMPIVVTSPAPDQESAAPGDRWR